ncbi:HisA/HisF-related TIM barrel protein [Rhodopirellula sp. MGV]|uniref:HisA/HisF-related TIM barrel protein n=1 Tax=Rhodopirellula sp. MGV TaxID=2023130 RepID=UPI000B9723DE|nr:HisA/HisF-related TIM barrel protein [Rhodopirellula sp. MGV]OYP34415.1 hypothetical protein CGZ80_15300 [Rhodopirellula sp. MGV]PNY37410.1 hypothetical protein C2E31_07725 [Rhodopirellula baltica]
MADGSAAKPPRSQQLWDWPNSVGVIDLKSGQSVHAVSGNRDRYLATERFAHPDGRVVSIAGDAVLHAQQYCDYPIGAIYIADLDAICIGEMQSDLLTRIARILPKRTRLLLDIGATDPPKNKQLECLATIFDHLPNTVVLVATETAKGFEALDTLTQRFGNDHVGVSFDFADGQWLCSHITEQHWIDAVILREIRTVVALDLRSVGTGQSDLTLQLIQRIRKQLPQINLVSGGGVRTASDLQRLIDAGANQVMVASVFTGAGSPFVASD